MKCPLVQIIIIVEIVSLVISSDFGGGKFIRLRTDLPVAVSHTLTV